MIENSLHTHYRPKTFEQIVGHEQVIKSLTKVLATGNARAFILTGLTGVGKTTIARLIADHLGCDKSNLIEIDAATHTGVEAMRDVTANLQFAALGESSMRVIVIDEAHMLSGAAWNSLLKSIEEPPPHIAWVFCTTLAGKIPAAISNRCVVYDLKPLARDEVRLIIKRVAKRAKIAVKPDVLDYLSEKAGGSARRAITWLAQVQDVKNRKEASKLVKDYDDENGEAIDLCRELIKGTNWARALECCKKMADMNPESIRIVVCAYFSKVLLNTTNEKRAGYLLDVVGAFADPYPPGSNISAVLLSLGSFLLS